MRVVVVAESFAPRSDETADAARHLVDQFLELGHDLLVVTVGPGMASYRGVEVIRTRRLIPAAALTQRLVNFQPDALLAISPRVLGAVALTSAQRLGIPSVSINASAPIAAAVRSNRHLVSSQSAISTLAALNVGAHLWLPGVDLDAHHPGMRDEALRASWAKGCQLVVGFAGTAAKDKVVARLTKVAAMDDVRLVLIGVDSPTIAGAKTTSAPTGLDRARAIASCDVVIQARKRDELVPGVRQALASGVPVVGFDAAGTHEAVAHEFNGLLVPFQRDADEPGLRGSLRRLLDEPDLRATLTAQARSSVSDRPWSTAAADINAHLEAIRPASLAV
ncbi:MAG TPA: glycosyltransferase [Marmoricola sp.]|nr:glycosyltransferase [Marmoricola sp.]